MLDRCSSDGPGSFRDHHVTFPLEANQKMDFFQLVIDQIVTALTTKGDLLTNVGSGPEDVILRKVTGELPRHAGTARATIKSEPLQRHTPWRRAHAKTWKDASRHPLVPPQVSLYCYRGVRQTDRRTDRRGRGLAPVRATEDNGRRKEGNWKRRNN